MRKVDWAQMVIYFCLTVSAVAMGLYWLKAGGLL